MNTTDSPGRLLTRLCSNSQSLVIAAPYIKVEAISRILTAVSAKASLICVTRWNPHDLAGGASDAECRNLVMDFGGSFRLHPSLHAKYYRIDDVVLVGSANLTSSAMGWVPQSNLEILCRPSDDFDECAFRQELLKDSREISDDEFRRWEAIVKIISRSDRAHAGNQPRLDSWRPTTRDPRHLELSYKGREDEIASFDEQRAARRDLQTLQVPPSLSDEEVRMWASACLLAAPFTNTVIRLHDSADMPSSYQLLAQIYDISMTEARRDMETVQSWLAYLAPETLV